MSQPNRIPSQPWSPRRGHMCCHSMPCAKHVKPWPNILASASASTQCQSTLIQIASDPTDLIFEQRCRRCCEHFWQDKYDLAISIADFIWQHLAACQAMCNAGASRRAYASGSCTAGKTSEKHELKSTWAPPDSLLEHVSQKEYE